MISVVLWVFIAYLFGSLPTGFVITKLVKGIDIREHGSGNPGATNVNRTIGPAWGTLTFVIDILKGFIPVFLAAKFIGSGPLLLLVALAAVAGHMWTVFLNFQGGKGVATSAGIFFALLPLPTACAFVIFTAIVAATGYVSLGSMLAAISLTVIAFLTKQPLFLSVFALAVCLLIIFKHRPNIGRLLNGVEANLYKKKEQKQ